MTDSFPEGPARRAVDEGHAEQVASAADAPHHDVRTVTLRELLDGWWKDDPAGPPTVEERASARVELGTAR